MAESFIVFLIYVVCIIAAAVIVLWAINKFLPEFSYPARIIVGVIVLVVILLLLLRLLGGVDLGI